MTQPPEYESDKLKAIARKLQELCDEHDVVAVGVLASDVATAQVYIFPERFGAKNLPGVGLLTHVPDEDCEDECVDNFKGLMTRLVNMKREVAHVRFYIEKMFATLDGVFKRQNPTAIVYARKDGDKKSENVH